MRRIRITLSYDGTDYYGWQVQPGLPTIQGVLEAVVSEIEKREVKVEGSGRTDAGVHALAQVAAFSLENPIPTPNLEKAMNRQLPREIRVLSAEETHENFHPRFDATAKTYEYRILRAPICSPFERRYVHHHPYPLNEEKIFELAKSLEGEHDFTSFAAADDTDTQRRSKTRQIFLSEAFRRSDLLIYRVRGSGFLKHMVRNIVGVLLEAGKGNLASLDAHLNGAIPPGPTAPARGLFLVNVEYGPRNPPADLS